MPTLRPQDFAPALPGIPGLLSDRLRIGASLIDATGVSRGDSKSHSDATLDETLVFSSANSDIVEMVFRALLEARIQSGQLRLGVSRWRQPITWFGDVWCVA